MDPKVIVGGAVVVVVLAVAGYAFATLGSDGESDPNQAKVLDVNGKQERDSEQTDSEETDSEVTNANDRQADSGSKGSDSERPSGMDEVPSIPNFREDCGNEVYAAGSASCAFSRNIAAEYRDSPSSVLYDVYSPETKIAYEVNCNEDGYVTCKGGVNATVYFYP